MPNELAKIKDGLFSEKMMTALSKVLPQHLPAERLLGIAMTALTKSPKLGECSPASIYKAVMESAQLGLVPDGILGEAYLVPYKGNCQLIVGFRGLQSLAVRSGKVSHITAECVYEADHFVYEAGSFPKLIHQPSFTDDRGKFVCAYAVAHLIDNPNQPAFAVMTAKEIDGIKARSRAKDSGPWVTDEDEMRKKTVVRRLCKNLPMSTELVRAAVKGEYHEVGVLDQQVPASQWGFKRPESEPVDVEVVEPVSVDGVEEAFGE